MCGKCRVAGGAFVTGTRSALSLKWSGPAAELGCLSDEATSHYLSRGGVVLSWAAHGDKHSHPDGTGIRGGGAGCSGALDGSSGCGFRIHDLADGRAYPAPAVSTVVCDGVLLLVGSGADVECHVCAACSDGEVFSGAHCVLHVDRVQSFERMVSFAPQFQRVCRSVCRGAGGGEAIPDDAEGLAEKDAGWDWGLSSERNQT